MDTLIYLFAGVVLVATALAAITVWARRRLWIKVTALVLSALLMPTAYASLLDLLGRPKPIGLEWADVADSRVLGFSFREGEAIYVWLQTEDLPEPRAYVLPWSLRKAEQLQGAARRANARGTAVRMRRPFEPDRETAEPMFYAEPQPPLPPKT